MNGKALANAGITMQQAINNVKHNLSETGLLMAYTNHGHQIPGSTVETRPPRVARCGGPSICPECKMDLEIYRECMVGSPKDYIAKAKKMVKEYVDTRLKVTTAPGAELPAYEIYIVWFTKTLENWKALLGTTLEDKMYYELTHNGEKRETYFDAYQKLENFTVPD